MSVLLYCLFRPNASLAIPAKGVSGAALECAPLGSLLALYSPVPDAFPDAAAMKELALEFHHVTNRVFEQTPIVPFRFPTVLRNAEEIPNSLAARAEACAQWLAQVGTSVQMDLRFELQASGEAASANSGTEYLRLRAQRSQALQSAVNTTREALRELVSDWRERSTQKGVKLCALVPRPQVDEIQNRSRGLSLPSHIRLLVSGPWPAAEFLPEMK